MSVPYFWKLEVPSQTLIEVVSGGETTEIKVDPTVEMGLWREIAILDLAPGAELRLNAEKSKGTVIADGFAIEPIK
jgi:hypothetical protein